MVFNHIILAILWIAYCVFHSVLASLGVKKKLQSRWNRGYKFYRVFYTVFAFLGLAALLYFQIRLKTLTLFRENMFVIIAGAVLCFSGLTLMLICIRKYFFSLSGLRSLFTPVKSNQLIISGVHQCVRHPLYLGTFAFIWGLFLLIPQLSLLVVNTIITVYTLIGITLEEKKLVAEFGDQYRLYQQKVPKLWPSLKPKREFA